MERHIALMRHGGNMAGKRPGFGRPPKYRAEFCEMLIKHMGQGYSYESFGATLEPPCARSTIYHWETIYPDFKKAKDIGKDASELFWDKLGIAGIAGKIKGFNAAAWIFTRKNKHGWRDHVEITNSDADVSNLEGFKFIEPSKEE